MKNHISYFAGQELDQEWIKHFYQVLDEPDLPSVYENSILMEIVDEIKEEHKSYKAKIANIPYW
jgi:hypothetical protein